MEFETSGSPFLKPQSSVSRVMLYVLVALVPGIYAMFRFFGWGVIINLLFATVTAIIAEATILYLRKKPVLTVLRDCSAVLTAVLLALALPPLVPWWITVNGAVFAIVIAKQLYGGLGFNPFNPAMAGYVALLISFPQQMTHWIAPLGLSEVALSFHDAFQVAVFNDVPIDSIAMATPLDTVKTQLRLDRSIVEIYSQAIFGDFAGAGWEWISVAFLLGGCGLLITRIIAWQIPVGFLAGLSIMAAIFYVQDSATYPSPLLHLFSGGAMLGAFFIATDPVTAATTPRGRLIYGGLIGVIVYVIRTWGGYPDGVAFAVLLLNIAAPTLDDYTRPRVFGR